jgi:uncharacterized protein (DUF1330 family)/ketosteroid isomerase-like protein
MLPEQRPITGSENGQTLSPAVRALAEFYHAFNNRDLAALSRNWAQTDEIAMDNPLGGIKRGWQEIRPVYERMFNGPAKVYVEFYDYTIHETAELFYAVGRERGSFSISGSTLDLAIRTTRIFRRVDGSWKQVHHHGSLEDPDLLKRYQTAVSAGTVVSAGIANPAYLLLDVTVKDREKFMQYVEGHKPSMQQHGGKLLFRSRDMVPVEGSWSPKLFVVHEWPSEAAFRAWYDSKEYAPWRALRKEAMDMHMVLARQMQE